MPFRLLATNLPHSFPDPPASLFANVSSCVSLHSWPPTPQPLPCRFRDPTRGYHGWAMRLTSSLRLLLIISLSAPTASVSVFRESCSRNRLCCNAHVRDQESVITRDFDAILSQSRCKAFYRIARVLDCLLNRIALGQATRERWNFCPISAFLRGMYQNRIVHGLPPKKAQKFIDSQTGLSDGCLKQPRLDGPMVWNREQLPIGHLDDDVTPCMSPLRHAARSLECTNGVIRFDPDKHYASSPPPPAPCQSRPAPGSRQLDGSRSTSSRRALPSRGREAR
jgi:hypothetical protein